MTAKLKIYLAYMFLLPAIYTIVVLMGYLMTGAQKLIDLSPLTSVQSAIFALLLLPTIAFMLNLGYKTSKRTTAQRVLGLLIGVVWIFNITLLISACAS